MSIYLCYKETSVDGYLRSDFPMSEVPMGINLICIYHTSTVSLRHIESFIIHCTVI